MRCLLLFRDALGRLPTAQELRGFGFRVSAAAMQDGEAPVDATEVLPRAAEPIARYGTPRRRPAPPPALPAAPMPPMLIMAPMQGLASEDSPSGV